MQPSRRCASTNGSIMPCDWACSRIQRSERMVMAVWRNGHHFGLQFSRVFFLWMRPQREIRGFAEPAAQIGSQSIHRLTSLCYFCSRWRVAVRPAKKSHGRSNPNRRIRRAGAQPPLPQNVEAEAALLGALMIDNRLVEDVQLKLEAASFLRAAARPDLRGDPEADRQNMVANPVTLRPIFEADEAMKELGGPGLSGAADRLGRGDHRRARLRRSRSTIWPCCGR